MLRPIHTTREREEDTLVGEELVMGDRRETIQSALRRSRLAFELIRLHVISGSAMRMVRVDTSKYGTVLRIILAPY